MAAGPPILIAGAGIAGLTAALALARKGFAVAVIERACDLAEVGAGIQLSPNASRILIGLGLEARLREAVVVPEVMEVHAGHSGRVLVRSELGASIARCHGAPWWVIHRGDLQAALADAVRATPGVMLYLGHEVRDVAMAGEVRLAARGPTRELDLKGAALIGADGIRSTVRRLSGEGPLPVYRSRIAYRATLPAEAVPACFAGPKIGLWLGPDAHFVHYPVSGGRQVNLVAVVAAPEPEAGWSGPADRQALLARFARWASPVRDLIAAAPQIASWPLSDRAVWFGPGQGPVTLIGDAAHAMLPFAAQGGAMGIEDAAVLAAHCAALPDDLAGALRAYEEARRSRVEAVQALARRNGAIYHLGGPLALARDLGMAVLGGQGILSRQDWIYRFAA
ncbi:FAD-dependent monooxygenase [Phreatobacter sp.]|uniref:FAD-dependent monooxygenase n=1 Tax=Phreatobacter sp. TaxID=1966341 RepID=UPI003F6E6662